MTACVKCGKEVTEEALFCSNCGSKVNQQEGEAVAATFTATGAAPDESNLSEKWKEIFALFDKAGGASFDKMKNLENKEVNKALFNLWAFFFGFFYYCYLGMWKKGLTYFGISLPFMMMLDSVLGDSLAFASYAIYGGICASRANIDYYKKIRFGDNGWI